ncbi:phage protein Gp36 family protein [Flagellimonas onchidii]|uniref:phage protein Gp36 family protein n=1 Tax=Flagellimonas onchidii TaxID=2562684 RepID=UPI0010A68186|nr:phage protein Gp36 family protein [Allomuricauda onchidii]
MGRFITDQDYSALLRDEIKDILLEDYTDAKLYRAEDMAISQIKNYLFGRYNTDAIFKPRADGEPDGRNAHIVMVTIDCAVYHLYTSLAPNKIPQHRADRYQDVLNWLKDVSRGKAMADLPKKTDNNGNDLYDFRITSEYPNEENRW